MSIELDRLKENARKGPIAKKISLDTKAQTIKR